jgi:hypothetical protein
MRAPIDTDAERRRLTRVSTRKLERSLYLAQRTLGDARAAQSGRLGKRVARRWLVRSIFRAMR